MGDISFEEDRWNWLCDQGGVEATANAELASFAVLPAGQSAKSTPARGVKRRPAQDSAPAPAPAVAQTKAKVAAPAAAAAAPASAQVAEQPRRKAPRLPPATPQSAGRSDRAVNAATEGGQ